MPFHYKNKPKEKLFIPGISCFGRRLWNNFLSVCLCLSFYFLSPYIYFLKNLLFLNWFSKLQIGSRLKVRQDGSSSLTNGDSRTQKHAKHKAKCIHIYYLCHQYQSFNGHFNLPSQNFKLFILFSVNFVYFRENIN